MVFLCMFWLSICYIHTDVTSVWSVGRFETMIHFAKQLVKLIQGFEKLYFCQPDSCFIFVIQRNVHYAANTWRLGYSSCQMKNGLRLLATFGLHNLHVVVFTCLPSFCFVLTLWQPLRSETGFLECWCVEMDFKTKVPFLWCNTLLLRDEPRKKKKKKHKQ